VAAGHDDDISALDAACGAIDARLGDLVDAQSFATPVRDVGAHLANCPRCRWSLTSYRRTVELLRALPRFPAPPGFRAALALAIAREGEIAGAARR
jgi:anti-sigma factor RsiW